METEDIQKIELELKKEKNKHKILIILISISIGVILLVNFGIFINYTRPLTIYESIDKPIIYIYPEKEMKISVKLGKKEKLTTTYPKYESDGWNVLASPNGKLIDLKTGRELYSLYWEGENTLKNTNKMKEGFIVKGDETIQFLEEKLDILGLNQTEAEEFIIYWLPRLQKNKYNYIRFLSREEIDENMPLEVKPEPDCMIRIAMEWKGLDDYIDVEEQQLEKVERNGYTVVEWGATELK